MKVLFFGRLAELAGTREQVVDLPAAVADIGALRDWIAADRPLLREALHAGGTAVLVNDALGRGSAPVSEADEVAFLPIVSGG